MRPQRRPISEGGIGYGENTTCKVAYAARLPGLLCALHRSDHPWQHRSLSDLAERYSSDARGVHEPQPGESIDLPGKYGVAGPVRVYSGHGGRTVSAQWYGATSADAPFSEAGYPACDRRRPGTIGAHDYINDERETTPLHPIHDRLRAGGEQIREAGAQDLGAERAAGGVGRAQYRAGAECTPAHVGGQPLPAPPGQLYGHGTARDHRVGY